MGLWSVLARANRNALLYYHSFLYVATRKIKILRKGTNNMFLTTGEMSAADLAAVVGTNRNDGFGFGGDGAW